MLVYISQYQAYVGVYFIAAEGVDKGTTNYSNGVTAARLLLEAEKLKGDCQPFSWVLFRPPWSPNCTCCKACIWHQLRRHSNETVSALQNSEHECTSFDGHRSTISSTCHVAGNFVSLHTLRQINIISAPACTTGRRGSY